MPRYQRSNQSIEDPKRLLQPPERQPALSHLHLSELLSLAAEKAAMLARKEIELAKVEVEADLRQEGKMAAGIGAGGICWVLTLVLLLVAVVFGLMETGLPGWSASLIVAAVVLAMGSILAYLGWRSRVHEPMATTRRSLEEGLKWARDLR